MQWAKQKQSGFTIVELLIVIVVIAILAAITIVAYNGIQNRAKQSAAQQAVSQANKKILAYAALNNDEYPPSLSAAGVTDETGLEYSYNNSSSPRTYGVTATNGNFSYYVSNVTSTPTSGGYQGHSQNGNVAVTNFITNPSFETSMNNWSLANGATAVRQTASVINGIGSNGARVTAGNNTSDSGIGLVHAVQTGKTYTLSAYIRAITAGTYSLSPQGGTGAGPAGNAKDTRNLTANQVARFEITWTTTAAGNVNMYVLRTGGGVAAAHQFDVDGVMLTETPNVVTYADGNSQNWVWNGTANLSTSTGPSSL